MTTPPTTTPDQIDALSPGQQVRCTIAAQPRSEGARKTIERLMRRDPQAARGLRRAQQLRQRRMNAYIRGNRLWHSREKAARVVVAKPGRSWTMTVDPIITPELKSVAGYLAIEKA